MKGVQNVAIRLYPTQYKTTDRSKLTKSLLHFTTVQRSFSSHLPLQTVLYQQAEPISSTHSLNTVLNSQYGSFLERHSVGSVHHFDSGASYTGGSPEKSFGGESTRSPALGVLGCVTKCDLTRLPLSYFVESWDGLAEPGPPRES